MAGTLLGASGAPEGDEEGPARESAPIHQEFYFGSPGGLPSSCC